MKFQTRHMTKATRQRPTVSIDTSIPENNMTKQNHKDECNVNRIVNKFHQTGQLSHLNTRQAIYQEITPGDFKTAMDTVTEANSLFQELPSNIRKRFDHMPEKFLAFCQDPANSAELIELGLANAIPADPVVQVEVTNPTPAPSSTGTDQTPSTSTP